MLLKIPEKCSSVEKLGAGDSVIILLRFLRQVPEVSISFFAFVEKEEENDPNLLKMAPANGWCPCDKITRSKMWSDIYEYTLKASHPWNLSLVGIYYVYATYLISEKKYTTKINETLKTAYALHCIYLMFGFFVTPFLRKWAPHAKAPPGGVIGDYNVYMIPPLDYRWTR